MVYIFIYSARCQVNMEEHSARNEWQIATCQLHVCNQEQLVENVIEMRRFLPANEHVACT